MIIIIIIIIITDVVNLSLSTTAMSMSQKIAIIKPYLKQMIITELIINNNW